VKTEGKRVFHPWVAVTLLAAAIHSSIYAQQAPRPLTDQYCIFCHNQKNATAGVNLTGLNVTTPSDPELLERVLRKVSTGEMPPAGMPRPAANVAGPFVQSLETVLDHAAAANPNPGRPAVHRLNRAEYSNAIRDILALDIDAGQTLPIDNSGYGFDNIGDVLSFSPALLERYMSIARRVARLAVGDVNIKPSVEEVIGRHDAPGAGGRERNERASDDLPFDSRGGFSAGYYFPVDGEYVIKVQVGQGGGGGRGGAPEIRQKVSAGLRTIGVTFLRESTKPEVGLLPLGPPNAAAAGGMGGGLPVQLDLRLDGARLKLFPLPGRGGGGQATGVTINGPFDITGPGDTASRARIFVCKPASAKEEEPCARTILAGIGRRAFRRPVTDADLKPLMAFYRSGRAEGNFDFGIEKALRAILVSPDFLFRVEQDPPAAKAGTVYRVSDLDFASRLSFFLWSSVPDDTLLDLAEKNKLRDPAILKAQLRRMLDDRRADSLVSNFAGQWLYTRSLSQQKPDPDSFPEFDESLRTSFQHETELFFQDIVREDRPLIELLDANYTFLNQRLAEHYGIPKIYGPQFRKVTLNEASRGGLLGQGSLLTVTSYPNRTSVVQRGKWILENLLGSPPPPPPPVPDLVTHAENGRKLTMREAMEMHRANAVCQSCHARMDPIGFSLENYDGVGKWRDEDGGSPIDASGKLPTGAKFEGMGGLKQLLAANYRDQFYDTVAEKLLTYALGRGLEYYDKPAVRAILRQAASENYRMSAFVTAIVNSSPFQMRRTPEP
jgi:Protein of unknown function (DUF1592)/Protein of unknown function (DUF1588)/Protein of unknown function (DUF1585)/Protein of unknown function (DUF1595)/Protein of unknown function (DUF1587)